MRNAKYFCGDHEKAVFDRHDSSCFRTKQRSFFTDFHRILNCLSLPYPIRFGKLCESLQEVHSNKLQPQLLKTYAPTNNTRQTEDGWMYEIHDCFRLEVTRSWIQQIFRKPVDRWDQIHPNWAKLNKVNKSLLISAGSAMSFCKQFHNRVIIINLS